MTAAQWLGLALQASIALTVPKPALVIILLYLVVATLISLPYQKWRSPVGAAPYIEASH
jgi:hypothetical protein